MPVRRIPVGIAGVTTMLWCLLAGAADHYTARVNYTLYCQGCHLADGAGTASKVPPLKDAVGRFLKVAGGREYLIQVPGTSQSPLSNAEVAEVLNWILDNFSQAQLPAYFSPYTGTEVARYRYQPLANASIVRDGLMRAIEKLEAGTPAQRRVGEK